MTTAHLERTPSTPFRRAPSRAAAASPVPDSSRTLVRWAVALVLAGLAWRVLRYCLQFPIWGDEAFICLNVLDRDYRALLGPLRFGQVAPLLFLWAERAAHQVLGDSELALRLFPLLAGVGAVLGFWRLARQALDPLAGTLAVGLLAVAYYPVRHSCEVKPYAFDLFLATALLALAVSWLREPHRVRWLFVLTLLVPVALGASYPAVFVAGAVSVVLLPTVWRQPGWRARLLYAAYNLLMLGSFVVVYRLAAHDQFHSTGGPANSYWADWFPPRQLLALARWLIVVHTGNLLAYPVGGQNGASVLTFLLCLAGAWQLVRARRWPLLSLCLLPFLLTGTAAWLHRYPYGGSARVAQHLAPPICLLAGSGLAAVLRAVARTEQGQRRSVLSVCGLLGLFALGGMALDLYRPYKTDGDRRMRKMITELTERPADTTQVVVLDPLGGVTGPTFEWYLRRHADRVRWGGQLDERRLDSSTRDIWCLHFTRSDSPALDPAAPLARSRYAWDLAEHDTVMLQMGNSWETLEPYEIWHWVRAGLSSK